MLSQVHVLDCMTRLRLLVVVLVRGSLPRVLERT
jgi:hypothetical protein